MLLKVYSSIGVNGEKAQRPPPTQVKTKVRQGHIEFKKMSRNLVNRALIAHPSDQGLLQMEPSCQGWRRVQGPSDTDLRKERHRASSPLRQ